MFTMNGKEVHKMKKWHIDYVVGNTYKVKYVYAKTAQEAVKKARIKNIVDLFVTD